MGILGAVSPDASSRRPRFRFGEMGVRPGDWLTFSRDAGVAVEVVDDRRVKLVRIPPGRYRGLICDGRPRSLTDILKVLESDFGEYFSNPTRWWLTEDGQLLTSRYDETYGPRP